MPVKTLRINLREYSWWTAEEFASSLEIPLVDAQERIAELLALEVIEELIWRENCYRFPDKEEHSFSRYGGSTVYLQMPHDCRVTLVKHGIISTLVDAWQHWRMNRAFTLEQRKRIKAAQQYQKSWAKNTTLMRDRFAGRY
jgi:hypothetical protein